ncbi:helix-turn-helix domain-containing protein [Halorubrum sp. DTA98]|uniref:helix-turn-helix domain-containing protein n=1 Tax=Halorubrum sp. DTA98 TaxID=3402163 RepID=UPI003AAA69C7
MREVSLRIRHHGEPESDVSARYPNVTFRSVSSMTGRMSERKRINELRGPSEEIEGFLAEFREADSVIEAEPLSPLEGERVYVALVIDVEKWDSISERLSDMGIHYRTGTTIKAGIERWTLYLADDDDLSAVMRELERGGNEVELVRNVALSDVDRPPQLEMTRFLEDLTRRQREVLATAIEMGYYEHQSGVGIEDVAEAVGLGSTTVWEHLSRAEAKVMGGLIDQFDG